MCSFSINFFYILVTLITFIKKFHCVIFFSLSYGKMVILQKKSP